MTLLGEVPDVNPQGSSLLLPATLQIPGIVGPHVCALKFVGEDLLEILPIIDRVSGQVTEPSSRRVVQVDGEELDDEEVIIRPTNPTREAVALQADAGICLAVILDNVVGRTETPREACIAHVAPERFRPWPLGAKATPFLIVAPVTTQIVRVVLRVSAQVAWPETGWGPHR
jgi:hypothetical protein